MEDYNQCVIPFDLPKTVLIVGASQCGKTFFIRRLLLEYKQMFKPEPKKIIYCYTAWQDKYDELEKELGDMVDFRTDIPSKDELTKIWQETHSETILVLDDKMSSLNDNASGSSVVDIVCVLCHHCHISCIITLQNLYHASKAVREIGLNSQYICLFKNNRSARQIGTLASQTMPGQVQYFMKSYELATANNYGYLIVDLSPNIDNKLKLRTHIFAGDTTIVYLPQK